MARKPDKPPKPKRVKAAKPARTAKPAKVKPAKEPAAAGVARGGKGPGARPIGERFRRLVDSAKGHVPRRAARKPAPTPSPRLHTVVLRAPPEPPVDPAVLLRWTRTRSANGTTRYAQALADALRRAGTNVRASHPFYAEARLGRLRLGGRVSLALGKRMPRWSRRVVHAAQPDDNPPLVSADVVTLHDVMPILRPDLYALGRLGVARRRRQVKRALRRAVVVTVSEHSRAELLEAFPKLADPARIVVVPNGLDHATFRPGPPAAPWLRPVLRTGFLNVACVLNAERRKRIDVLAEAAAASPYVNLIHVGSRDGPKAHREPLARAQVALRHMAKEGRYHALGPLDDAALRDVLASVDVVVHPSEAEGFGLPPLEALACGTAVLASDIPAHREVLGDAALYFDLTARSLADGFDAAWTGVTFTADAFPPREARLAQASRYSWDKAADAHRAVYRGIGKSSPFRRQRRPAG